MPVHHSDVLRGLDSIEAFCLFVGHGRSGSSIVGAFLDAHPHIAIPHEADVFRLISENPRLRQDRRALFLALMIRAGTQSRVGRRQGVYRYGVPAGYQGSSTDLRVIGDKCAHSVSLFALANPNVVNEFRKLICIPLRFVQVVRDPFNTIATMASKDSRDWGASSLTDRIDAAIKYYFDISSKGAQIARNAASEAEWLTVYHEDMIDRPGAFLRDLSAYLGQSAPEEWLQSCASIVSKKPSQPKLKVQWTKLQIDTVRSHMTGVESLARYSECWRELT